MLLVVICLVTRAISSVSALTEIDPHEAEPHDVEPRWGEPHPRGMVKEWTNDPPPTRLSSYHALWHTLNAKNNVLLFSKLKKIHMLD